VIAERIGISSSVNPDEESAQSMRYHDADNAHCTALNSPKLYREDGCLILQKNTVPELTILGCAGFTGHRMFWIERLVPSTKHEFHQRGIML
jgi:hypothetical protein